MSQQLKRRRISIPAWRNWMSMCFFFQAVDGIRDVAVTGVQTCALPISGGDDRRQRGRGRRRRAGDRSAGRGRRSEERRVGNECRSRFGMDQYEHKVLLIKCDLKKYEGKWSLQGDFVVSQENIEDAVIRR